MELLKYKSKLNNLIDKSSNVLIMGHKYLDLDAISSSIGVYEYVKSRNKKATIIINDIKLEKGVKRALDKLQDLYNIKRSSHINKEINKDSLVIVVDTNKEYLLQDKDLFNSIDNVAVIDHHDPTEYSIKKGLVIIDRDASSTCEMLTDLLNEEKVKINPTIATLLLSGIVLDTNNYVVKTTKNTYRTSYILTEWGACPQDVQSLLKQDIKKYIERQKVITNVKVIQNIALSCGKSSVKYRREDLAKIADTLLQFNKIEASFVIGRLDNHNVGISARSLGNINVGKVLEKFNGGGDENEAGAMIENTTIKKVEEELKKLIK